MTASRTEDDPVGGISDQSSAATADGGRRAVLQSALTCPACGDVSAAIMPTDACQWFHTCAACGTTVQPLPGDCCVFCSYGDIPCPPIQAARHANRTSERRG